MDSVYSRAIQCLKSIAQAIWRDNVSDPTQNFTRLGQRDHDWLTRNHVSWTRSMKVHIYGKSAFSRSYKNDCFEFYGSTGELWAKNTYSMMNNPKDPNTNRKEWEDVVRMYKDATLKGVVEQLFSHYEFCTILNTDQNQRGNMLDPVNNTKFLEEVNGILKNRHETPEKTLHELDQLSLAWAVEDRPVIVVKDDVAVVVPDKLVRGLRVSSASGRSEFEKYSFDFLHEAPSPSILRSQESEVVVTLPPSALTQRQVSFVVFQKESLFPSQPNGFVVNSLVVSVNIKNVTHFHGGEMQCFPSFSVVLLLLGQGALGENIRRREVEDTIDNVSINITINGVLELTIFEYLKDQDLIRFCFRMNVTENKTEIAFNDLALKYARIVSAAERAISYNVSEFLKIQCLKSIAQAIWRDNVSDPTQNFTRLGQRDHDWLTRNHVSWTRSMKVHIYGKSAFSRSYKNDCFEFYGSTGELWAKNTYSMMNNPKDPNTNRKEWEDVVRMYKDATLKGVVEQLFSHYEFCTILNTDQNQRGNMLDPVNNTKFLEEVNGILKNRHETPEKTLHELDQLSLAWAVEDRPVIVVKDDVAVVVPDKLVRGLRVSSASGRSEFEKYSFDFLHEAPSPSILRSQESEVVVTLPPSALTQRQVSFVVFQKESLFPSQPNGFVVNSLVVSVNIKNVTHFHGGEVIDIHFRSMATPGRNESQSCAYWQFLENNTGYWSQEGCDFIRATEDGMLDICRCNHLTHFVAILVPKMVFSEANESALEILTIVGCSLSIMGLIIVGATALLFRSWRQEFRNKIWLQMCMAILILVVTFLVVILVHYDRYHVKCLLLGVTLHYAVLASFCWMLVAAVLAYRQLALVFSRDVPHKLLRAAVFAWGAPGVVCGVLLSVYPESYAGRFQEMIPGGNFCYPTGLSLWLTVYAPISVILVTNWTLFALILRSVFFSKKIHKYSECDEALRIVSVSFSLGFLFGLPWVFGLFASNVVAAYLFTLTASFQGFVLFALLVIRCKKTRDLWANKIFKKRNKPTGRSAKQNRSSTAAPVRKPTFTGYLQFNSKLNKVIPSPTNI